MIGERIESDAGMGGIMSEVQSLLPDELERMRVRQQKMQERQVGSLGIAPEIDMSSMEPVGVEPTGTYDQADINLMAKDGFVVVPTAFGQRVFKRI